MRRYIVIVASLLFVIVSLNIATAAAPSSITVQGKLTDAGGSPLPAGAKSFTFRIYDAATLGTQVWPGGGVGEVQSITSSTDGLWVGLVGAVNPLTDPVFSDTVRWLEVNVDGTTLPRVRLVTGPYAFRVASVDGASGGNISSSVSIGSGHTLSGSQVFAAGSDHEVTGDRASVSGGRTNHATGQYSHVGGGQNNAADTIGATVGGGQANSALQSNAVVAGGSSNTASGDRGAIIGGTSNVASGAFSTLGGGFDNEASGSLSVVGGGNHTYARGQAAFVGGGGGSSAFIGTDADSNSASGDRAAIVGGYAQLASGEASLIGGGGKNQASGDYAFIGGGLRNVVSADSALIVGGAGNIASGIGAAVIGGRNNFARGKNSFIGGGSPFAGIDSNNVAGGDNSVIGGGILNYAAGSLGTQTIAGGERNAATGFAATIGGGRNNKARGSMSFIGGGGQPTADPGDSNVASGVVAAIVCGIGNLATDSGAFVGSGRDNTASGKYATISGGLSNTADGDWATIPGGRLNSAAQTFSFAAGCRAKSNHFGTFVWADSTNADFASAANNQFLIRASGGVGIGTAAPEGMLHVLSSSAGAVTANSASVAVFERSSGSYISLLSTDASERGILFGSPANALMGGIRFNPSGAPKGFNFRVGTNTVRLTLDSLGNLTATGCVVGSNIACPSDGRFKRDIGTLPHALETIEKLRGVHYNWKTDEFADRDFPKGEQIGLIAQEVQKVVPQAVVPMTDGYLAVDYARLVPLLIEAVKEQNERIDQLQKTIQSLKR